MVAHVEVDGAFRQVDVARPCRSSPALWSLPALVGHPRQGGRTFGAVAVALAILAHGEFVCSRRQ